MTAALISTFWPYILGALAIVGAFFGVGVAGYRSGRAKAIEQNMRDTLDSVRKAKEAQDAVESDSDVAVRDRARQRLREQQGR